MYKQSWNVVMWEPFLSPHKSALFTALADSSQIESVIYVSHDDLPNARLNQGWIVPDELLQNPNVFLRPTKQQINTLINNAGPDAIHIFSGIRWFSTLTFALKLVANSKLRFGIMSEPRVLEGWKGALRVPHSWITEYELRRRCDFVLAIGANGPKWFTIAGYKRSYIFPFGYFLNGPKHEEANGRSGQAVKSNRSVAFVGRAVREKGIYDFAQAVARLPESVDVYIVGSGDDLTSASKIVRLRREVRVLGNLPMPMVREILRQIDIVVVPSLTKDDGWGAVVSEALLSGASVVATPEVGASICLNDLCRGQIIKKNSPNEILRAVNELLQIQYCDDQSRLRRQSWASAHLTGEAGAEYLLAIFKNIYLEGEKPVWI